MYAALMTNNSNVGMVEFLMAGEARGGGGGAVQPLLWG